MTLEAGGLEMDSEHQLMKCFFSPRGGQQVLKQLSLHVGSYMFTRRELCMRAMHFPEFLIVLRPEISR